MQMAEFSTWDTFTCVACALTGGRLKSILSSFSDVYFQFQCIPLLLGVLRSLL